VVPHNALHYKFLQISTESKPACSEPLQCHCTAGKLASSEPACSEPCLHAVHCLTEAFETVPHFQAMHCTASKQSTAQRHKQSSASQTNLCVVCTAQRHACKGASVRCTHEKNCIAQHRDCLMPLQALHCLQACLHAVQCIARVHCRQAPCKPACM
jgi:hypothetical protein